MNMPNIKRFCLESILRMKQSVFRDMSTTSNIHIVKPSTDSQKQKVSHSTDSQKHTYFRYTDVPVEAF